MVETIIIIVKTILVMSCINIELKETKLFENSLIQKYTTIAEEDVDQLSLSK